MGPKAYFAPESVLRIFVALKNHRARLSLNSRRSMASTITTTPPRETKYLSNFSIYLNCTQFVTKFAYFFKTEFILDNNCNGQRIENCPFSETFDRTAMSTSSPL